MPAAGFEPAIPATKRPHTYALDRAATGIAIHETMQHYFQDQKQNSWFI
jgi:hypothetical protein